MPSSRSAGCLALIAVLACLGEQAQSQSPGDPVQTTGNSYRHTARRSTENQQAAWLEPTDPAPSSGAGDGRGMPRAAADSRNAPIPLRPPSRPDRGGSMSPAASQSAPRTAVTVVGSLGAVLGLFFLLAWAMRRGTPGAISLLPREALEVLGRAPLAGRQQVHLIRLGSKLVLISASAAGVETLSEVTEPDEVQRLTALCRQGQTGSAASMFRQTLDRFASHEEPGDA